MKKVVLPQHSHFRKPKFCICGYPKSFSNLKFYLKFPAFCFVF